MIAAVWMACGMKPKYCVPDDFFITTSWGRKIVLIKTQVLISHYYSFIYVKKFNVIGNCSFHWPTCLTTSLADVLPSHAKRM